MPHVITDLCTKCLSCPPVCPVSCIHPAEDEPDELDAVGQLFINPEECIDCGACASECPVSAIFPEEELPADNATAASRNADYYR